IFDLTAKTYRIGPTILQLASTLMSEDNRLILARDKLKGFAEKYEATLCVWRRISPLKNVLVDIHHGSSAMRIQISIGQTLPALLGSTGRSMATQMGMSKSEIKREFKKLRWFNPPPFEEFWNDALEGQKNGWS